MKIFIKINKKVITLECDPTDTIDHIKDKVHDVEGIPPYQQMLFFGGNQLEGIAPNQQTYVTAHVLKGNKTLADYSILNECTIHLSVERICGIAGVIERPPPRSENSEVRCVDPSKIGWGEEHGVKLLNLVLRRCQAGDITEGSMTDGAWLSIQNDLNDAMHCDFQIDFLQARLHDYLQLYSLLAEKNSPIINWDREKKIIRLRDNSVRTKEVHRLLLVCGEYIPYFETLEEVCLLLNTRQAPEQEIVPRSQGIFKRLFGCFTIHKL